MAEPTGTGEPEGIGSPRPFADVLLVEDNMLIALDTEDALLDAGVQNVRIAATADAALGELNRELPDFAVLDFNLGGETSECVAAALVAAGVPFCYATGYGDAIVSQATQPPCGVLKKPFSPEDIAGMLKRASALL
jgi:DNA-binding NtrC family response regulator